MPTRSKPRPTSGPMALTPAQQEKAATLLRLIAHPLRLAIAYQLAQEGEQTVTQLYTSLGLSQSIASQHLVLLKARGVLTSTKNGTFIRYSLRSPELADALLQLLATAERVDGMGDAE